MAERDEFEGQNLGNFHRVLPSQDHKKQQEYDRYLQHAVMLWNSQNGQRGGQVREFPSMGRPP
jgi:hypothetical protein